MKLNQLLGPILLLLALLSIAVWGGWYPRKLVAGITQASPESKSNENQNGDDSEDKKQTSNGKDNSKRVAAPEAAENNERTRELLQKSVTLLRNRSFQSKIRQRGMLFGTELIASGTYLHADGGKGGVRTELELQTSNLNLQIEMVNDGVYYFRRVKSLNSEVYPNEEDEKKIDTNAAPTVQRINLRQIREQATPDETWPGHWISFGGLYLFIDQARRCFDFGPISTKKINGEPYDVLKGNWKPEKLASLVPIQKASILKRHAINWQRIPRQIPLEVEIYFSKKGKMAGFPFRIVFYRPNEELLDSMRNVPVLITEYSDAKFIDTPVQSDFQFNADENEVIDITDDFLNSLRH